MFIDPFGVFVRFETSTMVKKTTSLSYWKHCEIIKIYFTCEIYFSYTPVSPVVDKIYPALELRIEFNGR